MHRRRAILEDSLGQAEDSLLEGANWKGVNAFRDSGRLLTLCQNEQNWEPC